ncbi:peptidase M20, partial [candidate division KSB1 bacterium]
VKGNEPRDMVEKLRRHVEKQGFHVVSDEPDQETRMKYADIARINDDGGYPASRTSMDLPVSRKTIDALTGYHEHDLVLVPTSGGSVPIYMFNDYFDLPPISVPIVNHDNNQHQPNENLRLGHFWKGIETFAALLVMK